jgi:hypothetical protein
MSFAYRVAQGVRDLAETAIIMPLVKFYQNPELEGNIVGRTKIVAKTIAAGSLAKYIGAMIFGAPTLAMYVGGVAAFRHLNTNYTGQSKLNDLSQRVRFENKISEIAKNCMAMFSK